MTVVDSQVERRLRGPHGGCAGALRQNLRYQRPVVCFDERSNQLLAGTRAPVPAGPGRPKRRDYKYRRKGTRNLLLAFQPYPDVPVVRLVLDNLNTHRVASLYETFHPVEARRIAKRLEFHYPPKHGSWLNMAEIESSVFPCSCFSQRTPEAECGGLGSHPQGIRLVRPP